MSTLIQNIKNTVIQFNQVSSFNEYEDEQITDISFSLDHGKNLAIFGPEKSGKDLILPLIVGKIKPLKGTVYFDNLDMHEKSRDELETIRKRIGYVTGNSGLLNNLSVKENIMLPLRYHTSLDETKMSERTDELIELYNLNHCALDRPQKLTSGERLRAAFARALILKPFIILMDNALEGQCPVSLAHFMDIAQKDIAKNNISFIITTYNPTMIKKHVTRFMMMNAGTIVFEGNSIDHTFNSYVNQYIHNPLSGPIEWRNYNNESK